MPEDNLDQDPREWAQRMFEDEYCAECGGDENDHDIIPFNSNWFARCKPLRKVRATITVEVDIGHRVDPDRAREVIAAYAEHGSLIEGVYAAFEGADVLISEARVVPADNPDSVKSGSTATEGAPQTHFAWYVPDSDGRLLVPRANPEFWEQPADLLFDTKTEALNWRDEEEAAAADEGDGVEQVYIQSWVLCERRLTPVLAFIEGQPDMANIRWSGPIIATGSTCTDYGIPEGSLIVWAGESDGSGHVDEDVWRFLPPEKHDATGVDFDVTYGTETAEWLESAVVEMMNELGVKGRQPYT